MRTCKKCQIEKEDFLFVKQPNGDYAFSCKECIKKYKKDRMSRLKKDGNHLDSDRRWKELNRERYLKSMRDNYNRNKVNTDYIEKRKISAKKWKDKNGVKTKEYNKEYCKRNEKCIKRYRASWFRAARKGKKGELTRLTITIRTMISKIIKREIKSENIIGCSYEDLMIHLGPKPEGNYHLDHICPCSQAQNEEELIKLQHYTNFRWLSAEENLYKSNKYTPEGGELCIRLLNREWLE